LLFETIMYAIVDIETTGSRPEIDKITEIAILVVVDGEVVDTFTSLVNPECPISYFISKFTGITDEMVANAPKFYEIAKEIVKRLEPCVFVAHNVRFDYSFIRAEFKSLGYTFTAQTLCTVKMSRKVFPGLPSYSLGNLCESLGIQLENRHRAFGDANATTVLFQKIANSQPSLLGEAAIQEEQKTASLPPLLSKLVYDILPERKTGVYYFYNEQREVIYIGKGNDIKKRVTQHFSMASKSSRRGMLMKESIADISFEETGNELIALLLESDEIKKLKPMYNISQKKTRAIPFYGIFQGIDFLGYHTLYCKRLKEGDVPLTTSDSSQRAKEFLYTQIERYYLCLAKCDLHKTGGSCFNHQIGKCNGACAGKETPEEYNRKVAKAVAQFSFNNESFLLVGKGRSIEELSVVCIESGQYRGFGYADAMYEGQDIESLRQCVKHYPHNRDIQTILCRFIKKGYKKIALSYRTIDEQHYF